MILAATLLGITKYKKYIKTSNRLFLSKYNTLVVEGKADLTLKLQGFCQVNVSQNGKAVRIRFQRLNYNVTQYRSFTFQTGDNYTCCLLNFYCEYLSVSFIQQPCRQEKKGKSAPLYPYNIYKPTGRSDESQRLAEATLLIKNSVLCIGSRHEIVMMMIIIQKTLGYYRREFIHA